MSAMRLFDINRDYEQILDELYDDEGVINPQALARLEDNQMTMEKKVVAISSYIRNLESEQEAIEQAKKAMSLREKRLKEKVADLQGYLLNNMEKRGITQVKCPWFDIKVKKCPPSVDDDTLDMDLLPEEYKRTKIEIKPDKIAMLRDMKEGVIIPGASMRTNMRVEIR